VNNIRKGKGYSWKENTPGPLGSTRESAGFSVDNLDKKEEDEAKNNYEKIFVLIRKELERSASSCLDVERERLQCCQAIADMLQERKLIK
jgi:hypothetical protein